MCKTCEKLTSGASVPFTFLSAKNLSLKSFGPPFQGASPRLDPFPLRPPPRLPWVDTSAFCFPVFSFQKHRSQKHYSLTNSFGFSL